MTLKWRRTMISEVRGVPVGPPDDWSLSDGGLSLARIYKVTGGPQDGLWAWFVQVDKEARPWNGGTGVEETGKAAREACEVRLPDAYKARLSKADEGE